MPVERVPISVHLFTQEFQPGGRVRAYEFQRSLSHFRDGFEAIAWHMAIELQLEFNSRAEPILMTAFNPEHFLPRGHETAMAAWREISSDGALLECNGFTASICLQRGTPPEEIKQGYPHIFHQDGLFVPEQGKILCTYTGAPTQYAQESDLEFLSSSEACLKPGVIARSFGQYSLSRHGAELWHKADYSENTEDVPRLQLYGVNAG